MSFNTHPWSPTLALKSLAHPPYSVAAWWHELLFHHPEIAHEHHLSSQERFAAVIIVVARLGALSQQSRLIGFLRPREEMAPFSTGAERRPTATFPCSTFSAGISSGERACVSCFLRR